MISVHLFQGSIQVLFEHTYKACIETKRPCLRSS